MHVRRDNNKPAPTDAIPAKTVPAGRRPFPWILLIAALMAVALALAFHYPFLAKPHRLVLDDAHDVVFKFRPLVEQPSQWLQTLRTCDDPSRFRPTYWISRALIYWIGGGGIELFWQVNWVIMAGALFAAFGAARIFCGSRYVPLLAIPLLFLMPPVVESYAATSNQEPWLLFFGGCFLALMLKTDRDLARGKSLRQAWLPAVGTWLAGVLYITSKEPAMLSAFFPFIWIAIALPGSPSDTRRTRVAFLLLTALPLLIFAAVGLSHIIPKWRGTERIYSSNYVVNWAVMYANHRSYMASLWPRIWPLCVIPAASVLIGLGTLIQNKSAPFRAYWRPLLFFGFLCLLQYALVLPWLTMVRNLLPAMFPLVIIAVLGIDHLVQVAASRSSPAK